jgi:hypothetical protein
MKQEHPSIPQLAAPGAGLPKIERFVANLMIRWKAARTGREKATAMFEAERSAILHLLDGLDAAALTRPVLINRLPGLEDSSRYWSLLMVVDHLRIVNRNIARVIASLGAGRLPEGEASIAAVKPSPQVTQAVIDEFDQGCHDFASAVAAVKDLKTTLLFTHPWFGPMNAATWHFMIAFHMQLHHRQMNRILDGLWKQAEANTQLSRS